MNQPVTWGAPQAERADAARNRRHLLATARDMLAEQGADKLTMDGLAERAGLGKGTVFRRFGTRADLIQRVCARTVAGSSSGEIPAPSAASGPPSTLT